MLLTNSTAILAVSIVALAVFLRGLVVAVLHHRRRGEALRAEIRLRQALVEKLGSVDEFRGFLELRPLTAIAAPDAEDAYRRIVQSTVIGCTLLVVAAGNAAVMLFIQLVGSPWIGAPLLFTLGAFVAATGGLAFLVAAGVSYRMLRGWKLLPVAASSASS